MKKIYPLVVLIFLIIINSLISINIYKNYNLQIENERKVLIGSILKNYPDLKDELVIDIMNSENIELGKEFLTQNEAFSLNIINTKSETQTKIILTSISFNVLISLIFLSIYLLKRHNNSKKIREINMYMNKVLNGDYSLDIRDYSEGELSILKNDIYKITVKLREQSNLAVDDLKNLEEVLSDISHQIKTPLTSMYVINDVLKSDIAKEERLEFLNKNATQLERIDWLVTSLLKLSRLESGVVKLKLENTSVKDLINSSLEPLLIPIELKEQELVLNIEDFNVLIDFSWTREALINIIKNASEHTLKNGKIVISAKDNPLYSEITITDNGNGISKKDLQHVFKRFYKSNKDSSGVGIGLNMAQKIINLEGGNIEAESIENSYTTFTIKLYKTVI